MRKLIIIVALLLFAVNGHGQVLMPIDSLAPPGLCAEGIALSVIKSCKIFNAIDSTVFKLLSKEDQLSTRRLETLLKMVEKAGVKKIVPLPMDIVIEITTNMELFKKVFVPDLGIKIAERG